MVVYKSVFIDILLDISPMERLSMAPERKRTFATSVLPARAAICSAVLPSMLTPFRSLLKQKQDICVYKCKTVRIKDLGISVLLMLV
jgi:hypothetical protein